MFGQEFFRRITNIHGLYPPKGKIKDWKYLLVYICETETCNNVRILPLDELKDSDIIGCRECGGRMRLYFAPMDKAKEAPKVWERIEYHTALGF